MYTIEQQRAMEYVSNLKNGTYKVVGSPDLLWIGIGSYQNLWIFSDGVRHGRSISCDWFNVEDFGRFIEELYILKNLLYYIENGHNEVTT